MRIFMAPPLYVQGPGALDTIGTHLAGRGKKAFLICDEFMMPQMEPRIRASLVAADIALEAGPARGDVTPSGISDAAEQASAAGADIVLGAGGGRSIDLAKGAALALGLPFVSIPTSAATDAAATRGVPVLGPNHEILEVRQMAVPPILVLADTAVIAQAPRRFLIAGLGECFAKHYEAEAAFASGAMTKQRALPMVIGLDLARQCKTNAMRYGADALAELDAGAPGPAFEAVVETILLMCCIGFENTGLAVAHSIAPALAVEGDPETLHGTHAGYGALVQAMFEERPRGEIEAMIDFFSRVGLPTSIKAFAMGEPPETFMARVAAEACRVPHIRNHPKPVTAEALADAMRELETLGAIMFQRGQT